MPTLSVLDQSPVRRGGSPAQALRESIELAQLCDRLGYHRYWIAEHHSTDSLASASPEILIGQIAAATEWIRVGSGGVMLPHYSSLKVAEQFRMLEALFPGRIDLGVGRAPGSDGRTANALAPTEQRLSLEYYPQQLLDLYSWLTGDFPPDHPYRDIKASPVIETMPELWMLGSSDASAQFAGELGWPFCFAWFINPLNGPEMMQLYRDSFEPGPILQEPRASIGVSVTCAPTTEEAEYLSWSRWGWRLMRGRTSEPGIPPPEVAMAWDYTDPEREYLEVTKQRSIHGDPATVRDRLLALGEEFGVDEFVVVTITYDHAARMRSYELLAEAFDLQPRAAVAAAT